MDPNQANFNDFSIHPGNLHPVADPHAKFSDKKKVSGDRKDDVLQSDRDSSGQQTGEGSDRSQLAGESENENEQDREPNGDPAYEKHLMASARVMNITKDRPAPDFSDSKNYAEDDAESQ